MLHAPRPARALFTGKTLQYVEQSITHCAMSTGALAVMIPSPTGATRRGDVTLDHYAQWLDGLVLHGGADVSPLSYGEQPIEERCSTTFSPRRATPAIGHDQLAGHAAAGGICAALESAGPNPTAGRRGRKRTR